MSDLSFVESLLSAESLQTFAMRDAGVVDPAAQLEELDLPGPSAKEVVRGSLLDTEVALFVALAKAGNDLQSEGIRIAGEVVERAAKAIKTAANLNEVGENLSRLAQDGQEAAFEEAHHRALGRFKMLFEVFHYTIRERLGLHSYVLGVRRGGVIVSVARKSLEKGF